jgi:hypothetical protein
MYGGPFDFMLTRRVHRAFSGIAEPSPARPRASFGTTV